MNRSAKELADACSIWFCILNSSSTDSGLRCSEREKRTCCIGKSSSDSVKVALPLKVLDSQNWTPVREGATSSLLVVFLFLCIC